MERFTFGDPVGIDAAIKNLDGKYPMELNATDLRTVCEALNASEDENAQSLLSGILSTLGVEYI